MDGLFEKMVAAYAPKTHEEERNAINEVMQKITLAGLWRGGFFDKAAFYGGTCLRIFHKLPRFSEDIDFSLMSKDKSFNIENFFPAIINEFSTLGRSVEITKKDKGSFCPVESAFLKDNTDVFDIAFQTEKSMKVKLEVDTCPPLEFATEQKLLLQPYSFMTRCFTLPDLYAGKMHALTFRAWKNRVKGRDWYDFEWYVRNNIPLDFRHLQARIREFNGVEMSREEFVTALKERLSSANINQVKEEVMRFVINPKELEIWSTDYFLQLVEMINFE
jgi:predicted nucleotidyltransferase component of viral defense system